MKKVGIEILSGLPNQDAIYRSYTRITAWEACAKWQVTHACQLLRIRLYSPEAAPLQSFPHPWPISDTIQLHFTTRWCLSSSPFITKKRQLTRSLDESSTPRYARN